MKPNTASMNPFPLLAATMVAFLVTGCAHPIRIVPNMATLDRSAITTPRIAASAGFYIPPTAIATEVTTPGGGGDNVRYFPYRDIEIGFQKILSNVFTNAIKLSSVPVPLDGTSSAVDYVIVPEIVTTSGGSGFFTWPPTSFTVDLSSSIRDKEGQLLSTVRVVGVGSAETGERLSEFGIAGRRAMEDALLKMQGSLLECKAFNTKSVLNPAHPAADSHDIHAPTIGQQLIDLQKAKAAGAITEVEYQAQKAKLLGSQ
jgi:hypothetical protein